MLELILRIGFSLLVVFGLMWLLARVVRRPLGGRSAGALSVLTRTQIGRGAAVAVVRVADRGLIVGVTEHRVSLLGEVDPAALAAPAAAAERREPVGPGILGDVPGNGSTPTAGSAPPAGPASPLSPLGPVAPGGGHSAVADALAGSALSPRVWRQAVAVLRDRTVRR
ncbi:hypothetical protein GCM10010123_10020 [Pilimelia anulata]|uniref:Flagellar protein n=1 Tax=Pilimelia anulata TaxID=53371 RepID=A0A8J3B7Z9_9ACTN|nr:flagellar biosynthetic protein FliO [Pilimelia anulata]GGJ82315.1 hypothetical protein GCM10010123_10020 [Pilimelia anulata]